MRRYRHPSRHTRLRLTLLLVLSLLFQQVALAAYACSTADMPVGDVAMLAHCDGMPMAQRLQATALCAQHCSQQTPAAQDARLPNVPPLLMPALLPAPPLLAISPTVRLTSCGEFQPPIAGIPPELRFRVLLI